MSIAVLNLGEVCPMPYALCPIPYALYQAYTALLLRKAIDCQDIVNLKAVWQNSQ
jgi:hypothetical protein